MQERAAPCFANRDKKIARNLTEFDFGVTAIVRKIEIRTEQEQAKEDLQSYMTEARADGNRLPATLHPALNQLDGVSALHAQFIASQESIDNSLTQELRGLTPTYILGLEKQIERLKADNDPAAVALLSEEIQKARGDADYFPNLILGSDSAQPSFVDKTEHAPTTPAIPAAPGTPAASRPIRCRCSSAAPPMAPATSSVTSRMSSSPRARSVNRRFSNWRTQPTSAPNSKALPSRRQPSSSPATPWSGNPIGWMARATSRSRTAMSSTRPGDHPRRLDSPHRISGTRMRIIDKCPAASSQGFVLDIYPGDSLRLITREPPFVYPAKLPSNRWTHVAATVDGKTGRRKSTSTANSWWKIDAAPPRVNPWRAVCLAMSDHRHSRGDGYHHRLTVRYAKENGNLDFTVILI